MVQLGLMPPNLAAANFVALWKDLSPVMNIVSAQDTGSILKIGFALSERPHLHRAYLVAVCNQKFVCIDSLLKTLK